MASSPIRPELVPFGQFIQRARGDRTQREVAEALGIASTTLAAYEQGRRPFPHLMVDDLFSVLGVSDEGRSEGVSLFLGREAA